MLGPMDEFPVHQIPQPIAWPGSSDRNFYDRSYFNAHDRTGDIFLITGIGYYPNLGVKDAFVLVRRGDEQTAVHLSDAIDQDRLNQNVLNYRIEVNEPLHRCASCWTKPRASPSISPGTGCSTSSRSSGTSCGQATGSRSTRSGSPNSARGAGISRSTARRSPSTRRCGSARRDRSWGIRPIGEAEPAGRPADPPFEGMWWLYVPMAFDDFSIVIIIQEDPSGFRSLNDCTRIWKDGRVEQLGWPRIKIHYTLGHPDPDRRHHRRHRPATAHRSTSTSNPSCRCRSTSAAATAATRTGSTACGRARSSPNGSPTT